MTYYILRNGERLGPCSEEQVRQLLVAGQIQAGDLAWREGLAEWRPLGPLLGGPAVPPPPPSTGGPDLARSGLGLLKGCLMIFGALSAIGLVLGAIAFGIFAYIGTGTDRSSKEYVDAAVPQIVSNWSTDELMNRVAPSYLSMFKRADMDKLFQSFSKLGSLQKYNGSTGSSNFNFGSSGVEITAKYVAQASFQNGDATFNVYLVRVDGKWMIAGFHLESSAFLK